MNEAKPRAPGTPDPASDPKSRQARRTLVVVPCGQSKIWDRHPGIGAVAAREAYTGAPFVVNRAYAERYADAWVILSAKYGFLSPNDLVDGPYNVTFKKRSTQPIEVALRSC